MVLMFSCFTSSNIRHVTLRRNKVHSSYVIFRKLGPLLYITILYHHHHHHHHFLLLLLLLVLGHPTASFGYICKIYVYLILEPLCNRSFLLGRLPTSRITSNMGGQCSSVFLAPTLCSPAWEALPIATLPPA